MKIAIYGPDFNERSHSAIVTLTEYLSEKAIEVAVENNFYDSIAKQSSIKVDRFGFQTFKKLDTSFDLLICVGGDGTT